MTTVQSLSGMPVDTSGSVWKLPDGLKIDWSELGALLRNDGNLWILAALEDYMRFRIAHHKPTTVYSTWTVLKVLLRNRRVRAAFKTPEMLLHIASNEFDLSLRTLLGHLSELRNFYGWAADREFGFDFDAAIAMSEQVVGSAVTGFTVMRYEMDQGPLSLAETVRFQKSLVAACHDGIASLPIVAAAYALSEFGCRPANLRSMNEGDVTSAVVSGGRAIMVPRVKARGRGDRDLLRERYASLELSGLLDGLLAWNERNFPAVKDMPGAPRPLFRDLAQAENPDGRVSATWLRNRMKVLMLHLSIKDDEGQPLKVSPRRLRYSFIKRHIEAGTPIEELTKLVDHSSSRSLLIYYQSSLETVPALDRAMGSFLRPFAQIAMGQVEAADVMPAIVDGLPRDLAPYACLECPKLSPTLPSGAMALADELVSRACALMSSPSIGGRSLIEAEVRRCNALAANARQAAQTAGMKEDQ